MSTFDFGDLAPWFGGGKDAEEEPAPDADEWKPQRDAFDGVLAAKTKAFDAFDGGDADDALDQARALLPDQPALRDTFERDVGRLRKTADDFRRDAPLADLPTPERSQPESPGIDRPNPHHWSEPATFGPHFRDHGRDFGARDENDHARMAREFYNRARSDRAILRRIDDDGVIRLYDPATNTFASYAPDGSTLTFFKPDPSVHRRGSNMDYWKQQPGR
ncbi:MAG: hypothetical protein JNL66_13415 [Alphaproteobacteria bacterium]|nr:hypothetical protein [Alphaproteobacteria bacterium]